MKLRAATSLTPAAARRRAKVALALLACVLSLAAGPSVNRPARAQQDDEVITVESDLVVLNVTATDGGGAYVRGLRKADFKVFEDGREQQVTNFGEEETPFAVALLLDTSGSMEKRVSLARSAAIRFLDGLRADDAAAVYSFNSKIERVQDYSNSRDLSPRAFDLGARGMTVLYDAVLRAAQDLSKRPEKRRAILVLSDGADTRSAASHEKALNAALAANATIYTVDMGQGLGGSPITSTAAGALRNFSTKSGGRYVATPGGQALREAFAEIVEELSNQYTLGYRPSNRARDGRWRTIEVKVERPSVAARTRRGYRLSKP
ncbi:MAG TPA: VWA domain-containing protein [Pyrinomonadaceae bacterium]|nr:VWA domain-containing protein [Pyrinomonadaceae bacterium]